MFSEKYQQRIIRAVTVSDQQHRALQLWQQEINRILATPRKTRPSERDLHEQFFSDVFVKALGFEKRSAGRDAWTLASEYVTDVDKTRPDGVLGFFNGQRSDHDIQVVIELKGPGVDLDLRQTRARDRRTLVDQAFSYAHKFDHVEWVIVSNYSELRLYNKRSSKYALHFDLTKIATDLPQLKLLLLLLSKNNFIAASGISTTSALFADREEELKRITDDFYRDYKVVRLETAKNILKNNRQISPDTAVTFAQVILDRILFAAFLEDLRLIPAETIEKAFKTQNPFQPTPVWENFKGLFEAMDKGNPALAIPAYNGGLFRRHPAINRLQLDDGLFEGYRILADYDFLSDLRVNILGHVFEQSITDLDVLRAKLRGEESDDSRRHDEGAYYTPDIVTTYIVERTIGAYLAEIRDSLGFDKLPELEDRLLDNRKSAKRKKHIRFWEAYGERLKSLKILDPSSGSGAFLVAAFDYLADEGTRVNIELDHLGAPRLFSHWDTDILRNNLYGIDLSPEAAEITRLSLWLKIARNKEKLVALDNNIRVGNAVVSDPADGGSLAFDGRDAFPEILADGGFDIIIGNPPYVRHELIKDLKPALRDRFETYTGTADLYVYFYELGYDLLKEGGYLGYITSNKWMRAEYGRPLRAFISDNTRLTTLIDLGERPLFDGASTYTNIIVFKKTAPTEASQFVMSEPPFGTGTSLLAQSRLSANVYHLEAPIFFDILEKMNRRGTPLGDWKIKSNYGVKTGFNKAFVISTDTRDNLIHQDPQSRQIIKPLLRGRDMQRWYVEKPGLWLIFVPSGWTDSHKREEAEAFFARSYPAVYRHLKTIGDTVKGKGKGLYSRDDQGDYWWELRSCNYCEDFESDKIVYPIIKNRSAFSLDRGKNYHNDKAFHIVGENLDFLSAILNSDLAYWYLSGSGSVIRGGFVEFRERLVKSIPVPEISKAEQAPFITLSNDLHDLAGNRLAVSHRFSDLLTEEFDLPAMGGRIANWHSVTFQEFVAALKREKISLTGQVKEEWHERFNRLQGEIRSAEEAIKLLEQQLNSRVEILYGLTQDEIDFYRSNL